MEILLEMLSGEGNGMFADDLSDCLPAMGDSQAIWWTNNINLDDFINHSMIVYDYCKKITIFV